MAGNFKVRMYDLQNRYKFKVFCSGTPYDDSGVKQDISDLKNSKANKSETYSKSEANTLLNAKANTSDVYTKSEIDAKVSSVYKYKGSVQNYSNLPTTGLTVGDVYDIKNADSTHGIKAGDNVAWNGTTWDVLSGIVDLSEINNNIANINGFLFDGTNPTKIKDFLTMMRAMLVTEGEYGVEWDLFATNNSSSCTKLYDNVGLSITPGTDSVAEVNNYPKIFDSIDCNYININGEDIITALKGMSNYGETPSEIQDVTIDGVTYTPDVGTVHFSRYEKYGINSSGKMEYSMSWIPRDGYTLIDLGKDKNGNFKPYFIIAKYVAGYDGNNKVRSAAGLDPACHLTGSSAGDENADHNMNYTNCINIFHTRGNYYSAALMSEYGFIMRDFWLKFGTRNTQSIMAGNTSNSYQYAVATAETDVHRVVLTNAQAANIDLLSCVSVGDRGTATNNDRINKYMHNICKCARVIAKETVDTDHTALILDHANFNTTSTTYVSTMHERSGYSKYVRGRYGSPVNNTNGKHGMVFNGIEIAVGGYEVAGNAILDIVDDTGKREVYVMNNATKLSGTVATIKDTYTKSSLSIQPTTLNTWNYITRYDYDITNGLMVPTEAGQSGSGTSTGFADGLYVDNAASGQRECLWLGHLNNGGNAGLSCLHASYGLSDGSWRFLARLSTNGVRG